MLKLDLELLIKGGEREIFEKVTVLSPDNSRKVGLIYFPPDDNKNRITTRSFFSAVLKTIEASLTSYSALHIRIRKTINWLRSWIFGRKNNKNKNINNTIDHQLIQQEDKILE